MKPGMKRLYQEVERRNWSLDSEDADIRLCIRSLDRGDYQQALTYYWHAIEKMPPYGMPNALQQERER